ncbi:hypothetical protein DFQ00_13119 [Paenibacillus barcinonensis]|uniref:Uncharacterized protein n=1 Tax=Paenibacillus barcinonensis TaxID=198119 RepID=A0A2V4VE41_PAEBA|nr:hypothetical protein DFQ00_13119 [Paenibacillus barcinonensis]
MEKENIEYSIEEIEFMNLVEQFLCFSDNSSLYSLVILLF